MQKVLMVSIFCLVFLSCEEQLVSSYNAGECFTERNTRYIASLTLAEVIYKIDAINPKNRRLKVSIYYQKSWQYLGEKDRRYFEKKREFEYSKILCPDGSSAKNILGGK